MFNTSLNAPTPMLDPSTPNLPPIGFEMGTVSAFISFLLHLAW